MSREWQPGDVASILLNGTQPAFRTDKGWTFIDGSTNGTDADDYGFRPLVVIDPEDRAQVERLARQIRDDRCNGGITATTVAHSLRWFDADPKPEEPTGLGAVVEDQGEEWVHFGNGCWIKAVPNAGLRQRGWADFTAAVRILSHGVTDDA